jgi:hypothetical protein
VLVGVALVAGPQPAEVVQVGEGAFDDPALASQSGAVGNAALGDDRLDAAGPQQPAVLVEGLDRQVAAVENALGDAAQSWPIQGMFCFTQADLPMLGLLGTTKIRSHLLLYRKALAKRLNASGPFTTAEIKATARALAAAFPPA